MTLTIELTPEQEARLNRTAQIRGVPLADVVRDLVNTMPEPEEEIIPGSMSPAEMMAYWERKGVLGAFADRPDSREFAAQLRREGQKRLWDMP